MKSTSSNSSSPLAPEITVAAGDLRTALSGLAKVISRRPGLPVLACVHVAVAEPAGQSDPYVTLTATDLNLTLRLDLPVRLSRPGPVPPFLLPLDRLRNLARAARPHEAVALMPVPRLPPAAEFPLPPNVSDGPLTPLPEEAVTGLLRAFACASSDETRPVLLGACLDGQSGHEAQRRNAKAGESRVVGTDGRHLYVSRPFQFPGLTTRPILPRHPLWTWKPLREARPWNLGFGTPSEEGNTPFRLEGPFWTAWGTCVAGVYPKHQPVHPHESAFQTRLELTEAVAADLIRLLPLLPGHRANHAPVGLEVTAHGQVHLLCRDAAEDPWEVCPLRGVRVRGPAMTVFLRREHLVRACGFGLERIDLADDKTVVRLSRHGECLLAMPLPVPHPLERGRYVPGPVMGESRESRRESARSPATAVPSQAAAPTTKPVPSPRPKPSPDPMAEAEGRLTTLRQALRGLREGLGSVAAALKLARRQKREAEREVKTTRRAPRPAPGAGPGSEPHPAS